MTSLADVVGDDSSRRSESLVAGWSYDDEPYLGRAGCSPYGRNPSSVYRLKGTNTVCRPQPDLLFVTCVGTARGATETVAACGEDSARQRRTQPNRGLTHDSKNKTPSDMPGGTIMTATGPSLHHLSTARGRFPEPH